MGHRLSAIVTRTGDDGTTGLGDGRRLSKTDPRIGAMGDVDELNSGVGMLIALGELRTSNLGDKLGQVQQDLLDLGGELSIPGLTLLTPQRVGALDELLEELNAGLPRLQEFVRPGGSVQAAQAHVCRTICRRAERSVIALAEVQTVSATARQYLNRLSDLMFVIARVLNLRSGVGESMWDHERSR